ncbi:unnamed protein product, partial [Ectocarpus sp. 8 AP-2014]
VCLSLDYPERCSVHELRLQYDTAGNCERRRSLATRRAAVGSH